MWVESLSGTANTPKFKRKTLQNIFSKVICYAYTFERVGGIASA